MLPPTPPNSQIANAQGVLTAAWQAFLSAVGYYLRPLGQSGTTANRPVNSPTQQLYVGQPYFDVTLGYMVWVKTPNPTVWVNASGTAV